MRERAGEAEQRGELAHGPADHVLELGQAPLLAAEHEQANPLGHDGVPALSAPADVRGAGDQALGLVEVPLHECQHHPGRPDMPAVGRLAQIVGESPHGVRLDLHSRRVGHGPHAVKAMIVALVLQFLDAGSLRKRDQLVRRGGGGHVVRPLHGGAIAVECVGEGRGIADPPRHLERLAGQAHPAFAPGLVTDGGRESREQPHAGRAVSFAHRLECTLEQRDQRRVAARARPGEPAAIAEGRPREPVGPLGPLGEGGRTGEGDLRSRGFAGTAQRLAERQQQVAAPFLVRGHRLEEIQGVDVVPCGLLERELGRGPVAGERRVMDRLPGLRISRRQIVVGELRQVRLGAAGIEVLQRLGDLAMKAKAPRRRDRFVDAVAHQDV